MAVGLDNALQIAKSSLFANQYRINVIGQNIANADNVNYSKKIVVTEASTPIKEISPGTIGTGINVTEVKRLIDKFLEISISRNDSEIGNYEVANKYLDNIQDIFADLKDKGLSDSLNQFWNAWFDLSNNPSNYAERISLIEKSKNLTNTFHDIYNEMEEQQKNINFEIENVITQVNDLSEKIAKLNQEIYSIEINPQNHANDLRDKRDEYVKELSKYIDIRFVEEDNKYVVFTANGRNLVNGNFSYQLKAVANPDNNNFYDIYWMDSKGNLENITNSIQQGELKGLVTVRDEYIQSYKDKISKIANALITEVNKAHSKGSGLTTFTEVNANVRVNDPDLPFNFEGLANSVKQGRLSIVVYDSSKNVVGYNNLVIGDPEETNLSASNTDINSLTELKDSIDAISHINAEIVNNRLIITSDNGYSFAFADDNTGVLSGLGINTFFKGDKYDLTPTVNIMATEKAGNNDHLYFVGVSDKSQLTSHEYEINYNSGNFSIKDLNTGETLNSDQYTIEKEDGHLTIKFDGIKVQIDKDNWTTGANNTYYIKNVPSMSVYDDNSVDTHTYQIDFTQGDSLLSITDIDEKRTLSDSEYSIINLDIDNDGNTDYKTIKIKKSGLTITINKDSYGTIEFTPKIIGAKYIESEFDEKSLDYINAGKVNSIEVDDSKATTTIHDIQVTSISSLTNKKYTIVADGAGNYTITDEDGNNITPTNTGNDFVEFDGIRLNFSNNTQSNDIYTVQSNYLDYSLGDNRIALDIANLREKKVLEDGNNTINDSYSDLIAEIGLHKNFVKNRLDAAKVANDGLMKKRDNVSGVSIDEEMTKLIQAQHAYIASAKIITVVDALTQNLLSSVR